MTAPAFSLRTLDRPALLGPDGPVTLPDSRAIALLVLLALDGEQGVAEETVLLRLTPGLSPARGRSALRELVDLLRERLGAPAIEWQQGTLRLAAGAASLDVTPIAAGSPNAAGARFLKGFSLPDSPEFGEWLEHARRRVAPVQSPAPRRRIAAIVLGSGIAVAAAAWMMAPASPSAASRFPPGGMVVLADVDNATGDTLFDIGLTLAATVALEQSGHAGLLPRNRIREALSRAGIPAGDSVLTLDRAREAAAREGVRFVIAPRIAVEASGYRLSTILLDAFTDRLVKEASTVAESRAGVLPALDRVLREVRATLGETSPDSSERRGPLPLVTTPSLEALRSYAQGARAWSEGDYALAEEFWHRAVDQDTGFAMALSSIARVKALGHNRDSARYYFQQASARAGRMTLWERLRLEESWASDRGDRDSAVKIAGAIAERFPSGLTWYNYGTTLMLAGRCNEATRPFERALALDSMSHNSHINLATCARRAGEETNALRHYEAAARIYPPVIVRGNQGYEFAGVLVALGLVDSAARHFGRMVNQSGLFDRSLGHRGLGFISLQQGRPDEAAGHFEATIEIGKQQRAQLSLVRGYLFLALSHLLAGDTAAAGAPFGEMLAIIRTQPIVPQMLAMAGWGLTRGGRTGDAEAVLLRLRQVSNRSFDDRGAEALLVGAIALSRGQAQRADSVLVAGPKFVQPELANLLRARALDATGRSDSAAAIRTAAAGWTIFGTEGHLELMFQSRTISGRTP